MNYYERHLGDYARDTGHLTIMEHGVYTLLLDRYYVTEAPLPAGEVYRLARARTDDEIAAVDAVLREFFVLTDGAYVNGRTEEEIASARGRIDAARSNGKRGGRPKQTKPDPSDPVNPEQTQQKPSGFSLGSIPVNPDGTQPKAHQAPITSIPIANAIGASPPDPKAALYAAWKLLPDSGGGQYLGKLIRDGKTAGWSEQDVLEAAERTIDHQPAEPKAFIQGLLRKRKQGDDDLSLLYGMAI